MDLPSKEAHMSPANMPTLEERQVHRAILYADEKFEELLQQERMAREGEPDEALELP